MTEQNTTPAAALAAEQGAAQQPDAASSVAVAEVAAGNVTHTFKKPYLFDGEQHTSVSLDLSAITGADLANVQQEWTLSGAHSMQPELDDEFCAIVAARAAKKVPDFVANMPAADYTAVVTICKVFLQTGRIATQAGGTVAAPWPLDLDSLTGRDLSQVKRQWVGGGGMASFPATDLTYCAHVAARASGKTLEEVQALPAPIFVHVMREVSGFLQS